MGHTVLWNSAGETGKLLLSPTALSVGAESTICVPWLPAEPTQFLIHAVTVSAQASVLGCQQLWPPATCATMGDWSGSARFTNGWMASYAAFTSLRLANTGAWLAPWQPPQRFAALAYCQKLTRKDCTSAFNGAGPA